MGQRRSIRDFLKQKNIEFSLRRYGIEAMGSMALGLFSSLLIGLIIKVIGQNLGIPIFVEKISPLASSMMGPAIAVAVANALKAPPLVLFSSVVTGAAGAQLGGPVGAFVAAAVGAEFGKAVSGETKADIIVTPFITVVTGCLSGIYIGPGIESFMASLGRLIMYATELTPIPMGILVSVIMGIILTLPISSAALSIMLKLGGIAGGAATVGCCCNMIGFAVISYKDNGLDGLLSQGLGTSMLQMGNIVKNPRIWIPSIVSSAILGPFVTTLFKLENIPAGSGMGTSGLVGQFGTVEAMKALGAAGPSLYVKILAFHFILPAAVSYAVYLLLLKLAWIKPGDMKLDVR